MAEQVTITVHKISEDGYPDVNALVGRVAFIWDGNVVDGWPLRVNSEDENSPFTGEWQAADGKLSSVSAFSGVTHWIEFPEPVWNYERR